MLKTLRYTVVLVLFAVVSAACTEPLTAESTGPEIFTHSCARCHGAALQGRRPAPQLAGSDAPSVDLPKQYFLDTITQGNNRMPSFGSQLTNEQINRLADYIIEQQDR